MKQKSATGSQPELKPAAYKVPERVQRPLIHGFIPTLLLGVVVNLTSQSIYAADTVPARSKSREADLMSLDLDTLANTTVTSASKKEEKLSDTPTAITVLSNDDLRRSGATSIAEALRLVPGADVAQINSSAWAISVRGFDEVFSRSLLVMVDGRAVYSPVEGGVTWDLQQEMLEDVDRVEVIRGPGGTLWGANAVNGVINIVSKSARDTQGTLLYGGGGDIHQSAEGVRYGGKVGNNTYFRVFGGFQQTSSFDSPSGGSAGTRYEGGKAGFRVDNYNGTDSHATWQGDFTRNTLYNDTQSDYDINTVGRWTRTFSDRSSLELQAYLDRLSNFSSAAIRTAVNTLDLSGQHNLGWGARNDVVWGVNYRLYALNFTAGPDPTVVRDPHFHEQLASVFLQDEFKLIPDKITLTAGCKLEYNTITGVEYQPNVRALFKLAQNQTLWLAVSRAIILPTLKAGRDAVAYPAGSTAFGAGPGGTDIYPRQFGNPDLQSAILKAYELGYRIQPTTRASLELAAYYNRYSKLGNQIDTGVLVPFYKGYYDKQVWENAFEAVTYGWEASFTFTPTDTWRLTAIYSSSKIRESGFSPDPDVAAGSPIQQVGLRSAYDFSKLFSLDGQLRVVDRVAGANAYVTADVRLSYRPTSQIELALVGQNLFQAEHVELGAGVTGEVPRGVFAKVTAKF